MQSPTAEMVQGAVDARDGGALVVAAQEEKILREFRLRKAAGLS